MGQEAMSFFVYMLRCRDGSFYTGYTKDISKRLARHNAGQASKYTRAWRPVKLIAKWEFASQNGAMREEARIKRLTRKEKLKLAQGV